MNISDVKIKVSRDTLVPTLSVTANIHYHAWLEMPIFISGKINSANGTTCAYLNEYDTGLNSHSFVNEPRNLLISGTTDRDYINQEGDYQVNLTSILSHSVIEHINNLREKDSQKSVKLDFVFIVKYQYQHTSDQLRTVIKKERFDVEINRVDWVNEFAPFLGIGNFLLLEMQIPNKHNVKPTWVKLYDRLYLRLTQMEEAIREGDWPSAMIAARQFFEGLKIGDGKDGHKKFEAGLKRAFKNDQHDDTGINDFLFGIHKFHSFFSKYFHDKDRDSYIKPIPKAQKEDAQVAFALAVSLLNLIGKKTSRK